MGNRQPMVFQLFNKKKGWIGGARPGTKYKKSVKGPERDRASVAQKGSMLIGYGEPSSTITSQVGRKKKMR